MRVFISCDMEGVAGVCDWDYAMRDKMDYAHGRKLMIGECNAAVEGALAAGAKRIVVNDSHDGMINLLPEEIHPEAEVILGRNKPFSMMQGLSRQFDAAIFIGYHAGAGGLHGTLAHTYSGKVLNLSVNGVTLNEAGINAFYAGALGVPLVGLSGDDVLEREMQQLIPQARTIVVKKGMGRKAAQSIHPSRAREKIKKGVQEILAGAHRVKPFRLKPPYTLRISFHPPEICDTCERMPGVVRVDGNTVAWKSRHPIDIYKAYLALMSISSAAVTD
ncbi:MAG: M55 family metallopeptidase [Candidatus Sumerlaeia bacterium]